MHLIHNETKSELKIGDTVTSFRGETFVITCLRPDEGMNGKVYADDGHGSRAFYPSVFDTTFRADQ